MEDLNYDTVHGYRNSHRSLKEGHPFERLNDHEYLRSIGAAAISEEDGKLHPTAAGFLWIHAKTIAIFQVIWYDIIKREHIFDLTVRYTEDNNMEYNRCTKASFVVIGKEGATTDGEDFIQKLWARCQRSFL